MWAGMVDECLVGKMLCGADRIPKEMFRWEPLEFFGPEEAAIQLVSHEELGRHVFKVFRRCVPIGTFLGMLDLGCGE